MKVLLIANPVSGTLRTRTAVFDIINEFCKAGYTVTVQLTQHRNHAKELSASAKELGYDMICCCGGDGTLNEVISGLVSSGSDIPLGYVPTGSTNDFASTLEIPAVPASAAKLITEQTIHTLDIGRFGEDRYFSYIASFGAFSSTSYTAPQELKNTVGHLAYVLEGLKDLPNIKPTEAVFKANGKTYKGSYIFGSITNTTSIGGIVKLDKEDISLNDGLFEVTLIKNPANVFQLNSIVSSIMEGNFTDSMIDSFTTSSLEIEMEKGTPWTLDGEKAIMEKPVVQIQNLHGALRLIK